MPRKPSSGRPYSPRASEKLRAMFKVSTTTMDRAGVTVSPAPRRHALAANMKIMNGSERDSARR